MIGNVVFDMGNVLIRGDPEYFVERKLFLFTTLYSDDTIKC